jgi:hypothetical protein
VGGYRRNAWVVIAEIRNKGENPIFPKDLYCQLKKDGI